MSTENKRASAIEIPLILDLICEDLTRNQLLACIQVSQLWRDVFQPQLDRFVQLSSPRVNQQHTLAVLGRASRIRSVEIDISDGGWLLKDDRHVCFSLEELSCFDFDYLPRPANGEEGFFYHPSDRPSIVDQSTNALRLIEHNPKLRSLFVHHGRQFYRADHFSPEVLKAISTHKSLTHIKIHLDYAVDAEFRINLLQHLPESIQDFELICRPSQVSTAPVVTEPKWTGPLSLRRLCLLSNIPPPQSFSYWNKTKVSNNDFSEFRFHYPDWLIVALVRNSPELEKLAIAGYHGYPNVLMQVLVDSCPEMDTIHLGGTNHTNIRPTLILPPGTPAFLDEDDDAVTPWNRIPLQGSFSKLKEFRTTGFCNFSWSNDTHKNVSGLLARSTESLERVSIQADDWYWVRPTSFRAGADQNWADCRNLKELTIEPVTRLDFSSLDRDILPTTTATPTTILPDDSEVETTRIVNNVNSTDFKRLETLRLTSLADAVQDECIRHNDYRRWFEDPTLDDYLQLPDYRYTKQGLASQRDHRLQFIRRIRELFGRLQAVKTLKQVDLQWSQLCLVVRAMTEETVFELLRETEESDQDQGQEGSEGEGEVEKKTKGQGWYGPMTREDLAWLGLRWPTLAEIEARQQQQLSSKK
ncbi:hypothetical protein BGX33_001132 [Mortierella sp. NVP41]|nr:hypothetical protein BGX33_001132 [Mortierella sp. NVP41]